jgi:hypothetical protein
MKLKDLLFLNEVSGYEDFLNLANIVAGDENSSDPEDIEDTTKKQKTSDKLQDIPTPSEDIIPLGIINEEVEKKFENIKKKKKDFFESLLIDNNFFEKQNASKPNFFRIKPNEEIKKKLSNKEITKAAFAQAVLAARDEMFTGLDVRELPKGHPDGGSKTFPTYMVTDLEKDPDLTIGIVIAAGGNKGHEFENEVETSLLNKKGPIWDSIMCFLVGEGKITSFDDVKEFHVVTKSHQVKRPFSSTIDDVGEAISDLTFNLKDGKNIYVSLKGDKGTTFANTGYSKVFKINKIEENGIPAITVTISDSTSNIDLFLNALGVDKLKIAKGFEAYGNGLLQNGKQYNRLPDEEIDASKGEQALNYLASQLGYGYVYFRRISSGGFRIIDLNSPDTTRSIFGDFQKGTIKYPYFIDMNKKSKQCSIKIETSTANYDVEIRSTKGSDDPFNFLKSLQCNVQVEKLKTPNYACKIPDWKEQIAGGISLDESKQSIKLIDLLKL